MGCVGHRPALNLSYGETQLNTLLPYSQIIILIVMALCSKVLNSAARKQKHRVEHMGE